MTVELALVLPVVAVVATLAVALTAAAGVQMQAQEAAAAAARSLSRDGDERSALRVGAELFPGGMFQISTGDELSCVTARRSLGLPVVGEWSVGARSCALRWGK